MSGKKLRRITFTSFEAEAPEFDEDIMNYMIIGKEICPETGKDHWQGYAEFKQPENFNDIHDWIGRKCKIFQSKGSGKQNKEYCSKEGNYQEFGKLKAQGERNDLNSVALEIAGGMSELELAMNYPSQYIKYHRGFEKMIQLRDREMRRKQREVQVLVLIGPPGCGKTKMAYDCDPNLYKLTMGGGGLWFDGYTGQETLLIDEMDTGSISYNFMLALCDRYELRLPVKGGFTYANWTTIFITSNKSIKNWWNGNNIDALERRITTLKDSWEVLPAEIRSDESPTGIRRDESPDCSGSDIPDGIYAVIPGYKDGDKVDKEAIQKWRGNTKPAMKVINKKSKLFNTGDPNPRTSGPGGAVGSN